MPISTFVTDKLITYVILFRFVTRIERINEVGEFTCFLLHPAKRRLFACLGFFYGSQLSTTLSRLNGKLISCGLQLTPLSTFLKIVTKVWRRSSHKTNSSSTTRMLVISAFQCCLTIQVFSRALLQFPVNASLTSSAECCI